MPAADDARPAPVVHCQVAHGRVLFNQGDFWGSHESFELAWRHAAGDERRGLQGLIQAAAACHKYVVQDNVAGALRLARRALGHLSEVPEDQLALDLAGFRLELSAWERRLSAGAGPTGPVLGLPRLAWSPAGAQRCFALDAVRVLAVVDQGHPAVLVALDDGERLGWGECRAAWDQHGVWDALVNAVVPALLVKPWAAPTEIPLLARGLAAVPSAVAGIEAAAWDLYARRLGMPLVHALGLAARRVPLLGRLDAGAPADLAAGAAALAAAGYRQLLVPGRPNADRRVLPDLLRASPVPMAVELGTAYRMADVQALVALDELGLAWLARPLPVEALDEAARLCRILATPVSLGPWASERHLAAALALNALDVVEIDAGLGGLTASLRMAEAARTARRPAWASSSARTAIGAAADLAFAAHEALTLPADLGCARAPSGAPAVLPGADGRAGPGSTPGLGLAPDPAWLARVAVREAVIRA